MSHTESYRSYYAFDNKNKSSQISKQQHQLQSINPVDNKENSQLTQNNASSNSTILAQPLQIQQKLKLCNNSNLLLNLQYQPSQIKNKEKEKTKVLQKQQNTLQGKQANQGNQKNALEELKAKLMIDLTRQTIHSGNAINTNGGLTKSFNKQKSQQIQQKLKSYHVNIDVLSKKTNSQNDILLKKLIKVNPNNEQQVQANMRQPQQTQLCDLAQNKRYLAEQQAQIHFNMQQSKQQCQQLQQQQQNKKQQNQTHQIHNEKAPYLIQDEHLIQKKQVNQSLDQDQDSSLRQKQQSEQNNNYLFFENSQVKNNSSKDELLQQYSCSSGRLKTESGSKKKQNKCSNTFRVKTESDEAVDSSQKYLEDLQKNSVKAFQEQFFTTESARLFNNQLTQKGQSYLSEINLSLPNNNNIINQTQSSVQDNSEVQLNNINNNTTNSNCNTTKCNNLKENITDRRKAKINRSRNKSLSNAPYKLVTNNISGLYQDKQQLQLQKSNKDHSQNRRQNQKNLTSNQQTMEYLKQQQLTVKSQNFKDVIRHQQQQKQQHLTLTQLTQLNTTNQCFAVDQQCDKNKKLRPERGQMHSIQLKQRIGDQLAQEEQQLQQLVAQNNNLSNHVNYINNENKNHGNQSLRNEQERLNQILKKMLCVEQYEEVQKDINLNNTNNSTKQNQQQKLQPSNNANQHSNINSENTQNKALNSGKLQQNVNPLSYDQQQQNTVIKQSQKAILAQAINDQTSTIKGLMLDDDKPTTKSLGLGTKKIYLEEMFLQNNNISNITTNTTVKQLQDNININSLSTQQNQLIKQPKQKTDDILIAQKFCNQSLQDSNEGSDHKQNIIDSNNDLNSSNCLDSMLVCNEQLSSTDNNKQQLVPEILTNTQINLDYYNKKENDKQDNQQQLSSFNNSSIQCSSQCQEPCNTPLQQQQQMIQIQEISFSTDFSTLNKDIINNLIKSETQYLIDPHYFQKQKEISWIMRAILLDWMMEVCMEFMLKKDTFYLAQCYVDRFLSTEFNIKKIELQLIGVTSMFMASKLEEVYPPRITDFVKSTDDGYQREQIEEVEIKLCKTFKWKLNPPTLNQWQNIYTQAWDNFIEDAYKSYEYKIFIQQSQQLFQYRKPNELSYINFRQLIGLLDVAILDQQTLQYQPRALIASFMYLLVGIFYKQFEIKQVITQFPHNSGYLFGDSLGINELFNCYLIETFQYNLVDLLPTIQYASTFFDITFNYDLPTAVKFQKENQSEITFEEFLSYQTHFKAGLEYIRQKPRFLQNQLIQSVYTYQLLYINSN